MGQSIGDLFVKLGFDVDDAKLKTFDDSLKDVFNSILKFAGFTATTAGFLAVAKGASDTALSVDNLTARFGVSTKAVQEWAAALHEANPLVSAAQGQQSLGQLASYLNNAATLGTGVNSLNQLGVRYNASMLQHPEEVIKQLFESVPKLLAEHPERRGLYSQKLDDIFGNVNAINVFERGKAAYAAAGERGVISQAELDREAEARKNIAGLTNEWDKFAGHITAWLAPYISTPLKAINEKGVMGAVHSFTEEQNERGRVRKLLGWNTATPEEITAYIARENQGNPGDKISTQLKNFGWSKEQTAGIMKRLILESGLNPSAVGDNGQAYGIAQWHPDRQKDFEKWAGHAMRGTSIEEQLEFLNYELTKGLERKAGDKLRDTTSKEEAYDSFTKNYERPAVTQNNTMHVYGQNAQETAQEVERLQKDTTLAAFLNRDMGASY